MAVTLGEAFGRRFREARAGSGLSQEECAMRAEIHRTQISLLENGERLPRFPTLLKLAGALDIEPGELIGAIRWRPGVYELGSFDFGEEEA